jgi:hypothetical protein
MSAWFASPLDPRRAPYVGGCFSLNTYAVYFCKGRGAHIGAKSGVIRIKKDITTQTTIKDRLYKGDET